MGVVTAVAVGTALVGAGMGVASASKAKKIKRMRQTLEELKKIL